MNSTNINSVNYPIDSKFIKKNFNDLQSNSNPLDLQKNFLSLLVAQIKNQDPTDPIKNTELTSQLTQINIAGGIERLNHTAENFSEKINKNQNIQLASLIGRHVMIPSNQIAHTKDTITKFGIELLEDSTTVEIKITDENNKILYLKNIQDKEAGIYSFSWDGKDLDKNSIATGKYNILVTAKNKEQNVPIQSLSEALVHSIIMSANDPIIDLGSAGKTVLSKVSQILQ